MNKLNDIAIMNTSEINNATVLMRDRSTQLKKQADKGKITI